MRNLFKIYFYTIIYSTGTMDKELKQIIDSGFNTKGTQSFKDIPDKTTMCVYGFKYVELTKYGEACILVYSFDKELIANSTLKQIYAPSNIKKYLDKVKTNCMESTYRKEQRYATYNKFPIITIEKDGYYFNSMNNKCPKANIVGKFTQINNKPIENADKPTPQTKSKPKYKPKDEPEEFGPDVE